jgi:hypothetical protein
MLILFPGPRSLDYLERLTWADLFGYISTLTTK